MRPSISHLIISKTGKVFDLKNFQKRNRGIRTHNPSLCSPRLIPLDHKGLVNMKELFCEVFAALLELDDIKLRSTVHFIRQRCGVSL